MRTFRIEMKQSQDAMERQMEGLMAYLRNNSSGCSCPTQGEDDPTPITFSTTTTRPSSDEGSSDGQGSPTVPAVAIIADDLSTVPPISAQQVQDIEFHAGRLTAITQSLTRRLSVCPPTNSMYD